MVRTAVNDETVAGVLHLALTVIVAASAAALGAGLVSGLLEIIYIAGGCLLLNGTLLFFLYRERVSLVAIGTPLSVLVVATGGLLAGQGVHDEALVLFPLVLVLSSLVTDRRWSFLLMVLTVSTPVAIGGAEIAGLVRMPASHLTAPGEVFVLGVMLAAIGAILRRFMNLLRSSLHHAQTSDRSYREIFDSGSDALFIHHPVTGKILDVNQTMLELYGMSRKEALAATPQGMTAPGESVDPAQAIERIHAAARGESPTFEWHASKKGGEPFWVEVVLKLVIIADEPRVLAVVRDISARREAQIRLRQAEKMQAVGQLAGGIAHDFNNQLTGILGNADLLSLRLAHEPELKEFADLICRSAVHSAELTQQLLAFARKGAYRRELVDLNALVKDVLQLLGRSIDKLIQLEDRISPERVTTLGDPALLQNAILNLVINARDAMPTGGLLRVSTSVGPPPTVEGQPLPEGRWAMVEVSDSGEGLSDELRAKVFEPFYTTKERGTGMGLSAVYGTARSHGGGVAIQSTPGEGAQFTLCLPFELGDVSEQAPEPVPLEASSFPREVAANRRVLIADDELQVARVTGLILEAEGWTVEICHDGVEAVTRHAMQIGELDLVILDLSMPRLSGTAALEQIRQREPTLPILLMTGYGDDTLQAELRQTSGSVEVLRKPFVRAQLLAAAAAAMDDPSPG